MALPALLSNDDLVKFRTRFCERFLQFGECNFGGKCQYSHNTTWRRRSPQKYLYEPRLCENIVSFFSDNGLRRHSVVNCHNGKNCKFAHSREEILYHPLIYKTVMCEDGGCSKYYCPFSHSVEELLPSACENPEYIRHCLLDALELDESESDLLNDDMDGSGLQNSPDGEIVLMDGALRMRKASGQLSGPPTAGMGTYRLHLPVPGSAEWNVSDFSAWVSLSPSVRIETVVRSGSPIVASELCRALVARSDTSGLAAKKIPNSNSVPNQYCLGKVMQFPPDHAAVINLLTSELNTLAKTDHRNLVAIKRVHVGTMPGAGAGTSILCLAMEQCSTSLYQAVVDGYRSINAVGDVTVRGFAKKLNPHNGTTTLTAIQRIGDIISGLQRLHFVGIHHLRLCPTNVLVDNEATFKVSDFVGKIGIIQAVMGGDAATLASADSNIVWHSPELICLLKQQQSRSLQDALSLIGAIAKKSDVYSLGCVVFFAMTGQHPFGTFATADRLAAGGRIATGPLFTTGGSANVVENMLSDYVSNQHLLYSCPLVLDLCFRCLTHNPDDRFDISEASRHPLFWDFDFTKSFILALPWTNPTFAEFIQYPVEWKLVAQALIDVAIASGSLGDKIGVEKYEPTAGGMLKFLSDAWAAPAAVPSVMAPVTKLWLKLIDTYPQVLIRAWDGHRLSSQRNIAQNEGFKRNHLHWMSLRGGAITYISHQFAREYYSLLVTATTDEPTALVFPDESLGLADACLDQAAVASQTIRNCASAQGMGKSSSGAFVLQDRKNSTLSFGSCSARKPMTLPTGSASGSLAGSPAVSWKESPMSSAGGVAGMTFVDPMIVKQMAAASAALTAVYDNPELVSAITKGEVTSYSQLVATATIYSSLLNDAGASSVLNNGNSNPLW